MKKIIFTLFLMFTFITPVYADRDECAISTIQQGYEDLKNVTYNLEYAANAMDTEGTPVEGLIKLTILNMPAGYEAVFKPNEYDNYMIFNDGGFVTIPGGVYDVGFYNVNCSSVIKKMTIRVPFYKTYCGINKNCNENPWFDGTYENSASSQNKKPEIKVSTILIVITVILVLIIGVFTFIVIKRRRDHAKAL